METPPDAEIVEEEWDLSCRLRSKPSTVPVHPDYLDKYNRLLAQIRKSRSESNETSNIQSEQELTKFKKEEKERLESQARVEQWKETIIPILKNLNESDFDIHEYGAKIMEGMKINESKPFKNIAEGRPSAEVVRYFIASLQLANTSNIEICGVKSGELSNDTFNVKLLNTDRYHEHLSEYHAPSEDTFRERMKKMRELRNTERMEEQNQKEEPSHKRQRADKSPNERRRRISSIVDEDETDLSTATPSTNTPVTSTKQSQKEEPLRKYQRADKSPNKRRRRISSSVDRDETDLPAATSTTNIPVTSMEQSQKEEPSRKRPLTDKRPNKKICRVSSSVSWTTNTPLISTEQSQTEEPSRKYQHADKPPNTRRCRISFSDETDVPLASSTTNTPLSSKQSKGSSNVTPNPIKGKNIPVRSTAVQSVPSIDLNTPSTSGICWTTYSHTSQPLPVDKYNFETELAASQKLNPNIQMCSTPLATRQNRSIEPRSTNVRQLFQ